VKILSPGLTALFVYCRSDLEISAADSFGVLLPLETKQITVKFKPESTVHYNTHLTLLSSFNDEYHVPVRGQGLLCPLLLSSSVLLLRSVAPAESVIESVIVQNISKHAQCFEAKVPSPVYSYVSHALDRTLSFFTCTTDHSFPSRGCITTSTSNALGNRVLSTLQCSVSTTSFCARE
jgi:hypothetical protein